MGQEEWREEITETIPREKDRKGQIIRESAPGERPGSLRSTLLWLSSSGFLSF